MCDTKFFRAPEGSISEKFSGGSARKGSKLSAAAAEEEAAPVVRATRVRRVQAVAVEEAEINEEEPAESIPVRKNVCDIIASKFGECDGLEAAIFKASVELADKEQIRKAWGSRAFRDVYLSIARRMIGNMDPNSYIGNKNLWERFENKELTLEQIANQNYFELCPENWQTLIDSLDQFSDDFMMTRDQLPIDKREEF